MRLTVWTTTALELLSGASAARLVKRRTRAWGARRRRPPGGVEEEVGEQEHDDRADQRRARRKSPPPSRKYGPSNPCAWGRPCRTRSAEELVRRPGTRARSGRKDDASSGLGNATDRRQRPCLVGGEEGDNGTQVGQIHGESLAVRPREDQLEGYCSCVMFSERAGRAGSGQEIGD